MQTPLTNEQVNDAAENYLYADNADIPADIIAGFIAKAAEEYLEDFTSNPQVSPRIEANINRAIAFYRQEES
ncbi:MAG: hypothetical protein HC939_21875 [Pleurocapsa sp. SU_5_0]|nr:hypothetical protein [Pleurocapsa sp. SU_5_0]NJO98366.1 hypothetical protein [Pleurocapsa sp. CRU_1_2]